MKKICIHCNIEKDIEDFANYKSRNGEIHKRNVCKTCKTVQENKSKGVKLHENETLIINKGLTNDEIVKIRKLLNYYSDILDLIFHKVDLKQFDSKSERIRKTIKIDKSIDDFINKKVAETGRNYSDIANLIMKKGRTFVFDNQK